MKPDFTIITQNLILRLPSQGESNAFARLISDSKSLHQWMDWAHENFSLQESEEFILANRLNWIKSLSYGFGVYYKSREKLVGMVAITEFYHTANMASIGFWIGDHYQKKGIAKEALEALIEFCFAKLSLTRLEIVCAPDNKAGHNIALKCGAKLECLASNRFIYNGKPRDGLVFSVIP